MSKNRKVFHNATAMSNSSTPGIVVAEVIKLLGQPTMPYMNIASKAHCSKTTVTRICNAADGFEYLRNDPDWLRMRKLRSGQSVAVPTTQYRADESGMVLTAADGHAPKQVVTVEDTKPNGGWPGKGKWTDKTAAQWVLGILKDGPRMSEEVYALAAKAYLSRTTLSKGRKLVGVASTQTYYQDAEGLQKRAWFWQAPVDAYPLEAFTEGPALPQTNFVIPDGLAAPVVTWQEVVETGKAQNAAEAQPATMEAVDALEVERTKQVAELSLATNGPTFFGQSTEYDFHCFYCGKGLEQWKVRGRFIALCKEHWETFNKGISEVLDSAVRQGVLTHEEIHDVAEQLLIKSATHSIPWRIDAGVYMPEALWDAVYAGANRRGLLGNKDEHDTSKDLAGSPYNTKVVMQPHEGELMLFPPNGQPDFSRSTPAPDPMPIQNTQQYGKLLEIVRDMVALVGTHNLGLISLDDITTLVEQRVAKRTAELQGRLDTLEITVLRAFKDINTTR